MKRFSLTTILSVIFLSYILYSLIDLFELTGDIKCKPQDNCIDYYLTQNPKLQLIYFTSEDKLFNLKNIESSQKIVNYNYNETYEDNLRIILPKKKIKTLFLHVLILKRDESLKEIKRGTFYVYVSTPLIHGGKNVINYLENDIEFRILTGVTKLPQIPELLNMIQVYKKTISPILCKDLFNDQVKKRQKISTEEANITLRFSPISLGKLRFMIQMVNTFSSFKSHGFTDKDMDELKSLFRSINMYMIMITMLVSSIHLMFDFLAFKNDIYFWKSRKSSTGLSVKSVIMKSVSQTIIFLYLYEQKASFLILIPFGIGLIIEYWKITRALNKTLTRDEKTKEIDAIGMKYLSYILYPLSIGCAVYSFLYFEHQSYYSWFIQSLAHAVYGFGFLLMLPQLFINYKLKSVAHLPWKVFMYKAFNTFIDDVFAFIIDMPTAHRVACFRDDLVFFIYLYQRWLYPVDMKRVESADNE